VEERRRSAKTAAPRLGGVSEEDMDLRTHE
jgi:hypothetical protein